MRNMSVRKSLSFKDRLRRLRERSKDNSKPSLKGRDKRRRSRGAANASAKQS